MSTSHTAGHAPRTGKPGLTMLAALLGLFIALLDVTVVTVALPTMGTDLDASFADLEWVANAYMLALGVFIVTAGRLGDIFGRRRIYIVGVVVFLLGSLACGAAGEFSLFGWSHITMVHAGRVVQGIGGAVILPLTLAIVYASFEGKTRALGVMLWGAVGGLATALGPLVGGLLVEHAGWEWIFLVNLPIGVVVVVAAVVGMAKDAETSSGSAERRPLDLLGLITVSGSLFCLNLGLIEGPEWGWTSGRVFGLFAASAALLVLFLAVEARSAMPIMDLSWFRRPSFGGSVLAGLLLGAGMFSTLFYIAIYLQNGLGLSAMEAGVRLLPMTLMLMVGAPLGGRLAAKVGARNTLVLSLVLMAVGIALFTMIDPDGGKGSWTLLLPGMLITGLTMGIVMPISSELVVAAGPQDQIGVSASAGTMFRQVGNAIGIALIGAMMTSQSDEAAEEVGRLKEAGTLTPDAVTDLKQHAVTDGMVQGSWYAVAVTVAAAVIVLLFVRDLKPAGPSADTQPVAEPPHRHPADLGQPAV